MATRRASRISRRQVLVAAALALVVCSSGTSAAKCYYPKKSTTAPAVTTAPDVVSFDYPDTGTPTVTDSPNQETTEAPTQVTTDAPEVTIPASGSSSTGTESLAQSSYEDSLQSAAGSLSTTDSSSDVPTQGSSEGSSVDTAGSQSTQASTAGSSAETPSTGNSTSSGDHATFGDITSGSDKCVVGDPSAYISTADVDWVWTQRMNKYVPDFKNYIFDQLVTNKGKLSYCVRWDSTNKLSKTDASKFEAMLNRQFKAWNEWLIGYECWPFEQIEVKIVGWATKDASLFGWTDDSLGTIYTTEKDSDGIAQCPETCYKHKDFAASADTSSCTGEPFDMSLWPTLGQGGGAGGDWGQRVDEENMMSTLDQEQLTIVAHEIGHGFGLPDFYETTDQPNEDFPVCIMKAGSSPTITPGDGWMLRRVLENLKARYDF